MLYEKIISELKKDIFQIWFDEYWDNDNFEENMGFPLNFEDDFDEMMRIENPEIKYGSKQYYEMYNKKLKEELFPYAREWFDNRVSELEEQLSYHAEYGENSIIGYRMMGIEDPEEVIEYYKNGEYPPGYSGIGLCYSFEESKAEAHSYVGGCHLLYEVEIPLSSVDLESTFLLNLCPSLGLEEAEIRVKESHPIVLKKIIYRKDNEVIFSGNLNLLA